ncbi:MAG: FIST N-terminal domain-containing protein [Nannocystaceae bacterium]|nr:FIST C-terminal domain-containing protein [Myxococcales bacterium]
MHVETVRHAIDSGWSAALPTSLDSERTLVLVFGAPEYVDRPEVIAELRAAFPRACLLGCSSAGEIYGNKVYDSSLAVAVASFEHTALRLASASIGDASGSYAAGEAIARALVDDSLRGVHVLSEGIRVNGTELVRGINSIVADDVVVTGGLAGDGDRFGRTWVVADGRPVSDTITAVGFYGDHVCIGHGSKGGWDPFGPTRMVTRSEGNVLYELDSTPALELYERYLGDRAAGLPATGLLFPLAMDRDGSDRRVVRTILAVNREAQSLTFAGDIPVGARVQLMKANFDRLVEGAEEAGELAHERGGDGGPSLAIAVSCVGRRLVLGERTEEEVEATLEALPEGVAQIGFYSYGELSPHKGASCDLHNQTMTITTIRELD